MGRPGPLEIENIIRQEAHYSWSGVHVEDRMAQMRERHVLQAICGNKNTVHSSFCVLTSTEFPPDMDHRSSTCISIIGYFLSISI
ncbi:hypothetical protein ACN38_g6292 [Penicillium nordicum]|uniref:Uncharacterized protein n=1 Tax=Penicillium nordicum TaxID=229535 RepID=A0A0M8P8C4_9EURO|nr:hypothetical protein ACN38_g6292 [Penicillium nordicum]